MICWLIPASQGEDVFCTLSWKEEIWWVKVQCLSTRKQKRLFSSSRASLQPSAMNSCMSIWRVVRVSRHCKSTHMYQWVTQRSSQLLHIYIQSIHNQSARTEINGFVFCCPRLTSCPGLSYLHVHMVWSHLVPFTAELNWCEGSSVPNVLITLLQGNTHTRRGFTLLSDLVFNERTAQQREERTGHRTQGGVCYLHQQPGLIMSEDKWS